jgi:hypothetical protein
MRVERPPTNKCCAAAAGGAGAAEEAEQARRQLAAAEAQLGAARAELAATAQRAALQAEAYQRQLALVQQQAAQQEQLRWQQHTAALDTVGRPCARACCGDVSARAGGQTCTSLSLARPRVCALAALSSSTGVWRVGGLDGSNGSLAAALEACGLVVGWGGAPVHLSGPVTDPCLSVAPASASQQRHVRVASRCSAPQAGWAQQSLHWSVSVVLLRARCTWHRYTACSWSAPAHLSPRQLLPGATTSRLGQLSRTGCREHTPASHVTQHGGVVCYSAYARHAPAARQSSTCAQMNRHQCNHEHVQR